MLNKDVKSLRENIINFLPEAFKNIII